MKVSDETSAAFDARLDSVPMSPGVYLMKDAEGSVIYVGKAKQLRQRLRSYFGEQGPVGNAKVRAMVSHIADFSFIICRHEMEAFVLEANLIKSYRPFYNILLKDDRDYPYLRVSMHEAYPRIHKAYRIGADQAQGARYYGPYLAGDLYHALRTIHELFPLKTCRRVFPRDIGKERPCLNYYIHRCIGPCLGDVSQEAYRAVMEQVCAFLEGRYSGLMDNIRKQMMAAAVELRFEEAAKWKERFERLQRLQERQVAVTNYRRDSDVLGLACGEALACLVRLELRDGKVSATTTHFLSAGGEAPGELLLAFIGQYYQGENLPRSLLISSAFSAEEAAAANQLLAALTAPSPENEHEKRLIPAVERPQRGAKRQLQEMAQKTAEETLRRKQLLGAGGDAELMRNALQSLARLCGMGRKLPLRIEAFDVSNYAADDKVCGMIVFQEGRAQKKAYRLFKIKSVVGQDDYASMEEALRRRLARLEETDFGAPPDLLLLDGGSQHAAMGATLLNELGLQTIAVAGMVKDERHRTRGLALPDGRVIELRRAANDKSDAGRPAEALSSLQGQELLSAEDAEGLWRLLTRIQDEAHRFAGRYRQKLGRKRQLRYSLEDIPGIGAQRRRALLAAFPSVKAISEADEETLLKAVPLLGRKQAHVLAEHFAAQRAVAGSPEAAAVQGEVQTVPESSVEAAASEQDWEGR